MDFFKNINFSSANEDGRTELKALQMTPEDHILCLTGSGARALDLLLGNPEHITSIDLNPAQNALLALKIAAYKTLSDDDLWAYLGIINCDTRLDIHKKIEPQLNDEYREFWVQNYKMIKAGVWYSGLWERVLAKISTIANLFRGKLIRDLFTAETIREQQDLWHNKWDGFIWQSTIKLLSFSSLWTKVVGEPGGAFIPSKTEASKIIHSRFSKMIDNSLLHESDFASLMFRGCHIPEQALPLHIQKKNIDRIRKNLHKIEVRTGSLNKLHELDIAPVNGFSISDFSSYCGQSLYDETWKSILKAAATNARVCERVFMNEIRPSSFIDSQIEWDEILSDSLSRIDNSVIYNIRVGTIK